MRARADRVYPSHAFKQKVRAALEQKRRLSKDTRRGTSIPGMGGMTASQLHFILHRHGRVRTNDPGVIAIGAALGLSPEECFGPPRGRPLPRYHGSQG